LKYTSRSGSLPYTLHFCLLVAFSFASAYGVAWLLRPPPVAEPRAALNRQQLFRNYRILNDFLAVDPDRPGAEAAEPPLLKAIVSLQRAEEAFAARRYAESAAALAAVPGRFSFLEGRRDSLGLKLLHANRRYAQAVAFSDRRPPVDLEARVLRLDCLLKTGRRQEAFAEFRPLFARQGLAAFTSTISRSDLAALLRQLPEGDWFAKFSFLLETRQAGEFRRELPASGFRDLNRLFQGEFAYLGRAYARARQLLRPPLPETYRPLAERTLLRIDVHEDPSLDVEERLQRIGRESALYPELLLDLAQILVAKGEFDRAQPFFESYLESGEEKDERYWKTVWLLAWIHYRLDDKERALKYFRLGGTSPILAYRIACRYWHGKLEENVTPELGGYPFSYYAVKFLGSRERFKGRTRAFLAGLDDPPGEAFLELVKELRPMAARGMLAEAAEAVHWAKQDPRLRPGDLNLLKVIESLLYYRQNQYFAAYSKFRGNFPALEGVHLPSFLSGLLFPRAYEETITAYSREQEVDPSLVLALIREESFFRSDARSAANAYGLMQLLQGTARQVANGSGLKIKAKDLYDPEVNIRLGLAYLKMLLDRYDGRLYLALAAYNAGPHRVDQWLQDFHLADEEEFIEMIPFSETRTYVKNILRNYFFYRYYYAAGEAS
jgi:soluble lytic murein transglycosylase-like protein